MDSNAKRSSTDGTLFPPTQWGLLNAIKTAPDQTHRNTLDQIIRLYWKPVYIFVRRLGHSEANAEDITQGFFTDCLRRGFFARAEPERGRFRTFLLTSLNHYIQNLHRAGHAQRRQPGGGIVSLDELCEAQPGVFDPPAQGTPEDAFNRSWAVGLVRASLELFQAECLKTSKLPHYSIFFERLIRPALEGGTATSLAELAERLALTEKQAANCLVTARRAFQRILREQLAPCVGSEAELDAEVQHLFTLLGTP